MPAIGHSRNEHLVLDIADNIARLTIDRPDKRNALNQAMWCDLGSIVSKAAADPNVRVLVIGGAGADFSAGADIAEFDTVRRDGETARAYEAANSAAFTAVRDAAVPTIAAIRGVCFGGGFGIAAACDLRLAADDSRFSVPAARLGLAYPHDAMADIVHACGPQYARYLTFSGAAISASEALRVGFLAEICAPRELEARALDIARQIAGAAPLSVRASKAAIRAVLSGSEDDIASAHARGAATFDSADYEEGRNAFRERRDPVFRGK
ncbi:MAG: enoyl-CoA hydratase-related protein [Rhizobiaceae bacterium]